MRSSINYPAKDVVLGVLEIAIGREAEKQGEVELLRQMLGYDVVLIHNEDGKPFIKGYNISISHTKGFVASLLSRHLQVGIDIEYHSDRIQKIAQRFLRSDEKYTLTSDLLTVWCAKEAVYKLFSEQHLTYQEMKVDVMNRQLLNLKTNVIIDFVLSVYSKYIMVTCWRNNKKRV